MTAPRPTGILRWLFRVPPHLYRWHCWWLLGNRFLLLIHVGRRTGRRHQTVLEVVEYRRGGPEAIVISAFGRNPDWLRNIQATPGAEVVIGPRRFAAIHRFLGEEEAVGVVSRYERRNWFMAPIIRMVLSRLLGWRYHGSQIERRRLVAQLPLIAFLPRSEINGTCKDRSSGQIAFKASRH
jgi:deazaflavin-dependent oxidoreductase (nitroreductase family)